MQQLPRDKDQLLQFLREYKKTHGSVPIEIMQQAEQIIQQSKGQPSKVDYSALNKSNPRMREELSKLEGAPLDDFVSSNETLRGLNLPFAEF
jgi:3-oxoacyl-[acyl-carrier-protein] synthase III